MHHKMTNFQHNKRGDFGKVVNTQIFECHLILLIVTQFGVPKTGKTNRSLFWFSLPPSLNV